MTNDERALQALSEAMADGAAIDWTTAEAAAGDESARQLVRDLRSIAGIADVHARQPITDIRTDATWGPLRLLERIGAGAYGEVYRAWDPRLEREVALKLVPADPSSPDAAPSTVIDEGRMIARLRHPNVVTIYGAEQIGDRIGLWMEFVPGRTLDQLLADGQEFDDLEVLGIGLELCRAVSAVHGAGLLHRDIKAQNVTRADDGRIVLMDFGAGRNFDDSTGSDLTGTPLYLAPEIFRGAPATVQSEIYSIGVLLYRLACGSYPVQARTLGELRVAHERGERVPLRAAKPAVGKSLARVIERAIAPEPEHRQQSAGALGDDLAAIKRRPKTVGAVGAALAVVVAGLMVWTFGVNRPEPALTTPRPSVAVLGFRNASGDTADAWVSHALTDMLSRELRAGDRVGVVPWDLVGVVKNKLGFSDADSFQRDVLDRIRTNLGAAFVVVGSYTVSGSDATQAIQLDLRVQDTHTGTSVATMRETTSQAALLDGVARAGARLRRHFGARSLTEAQARQLRDGQPVSGEAARAYGEAVRSLRANEPDAVTHAAFERASALDPTFAMNHVFLRYTWGRLGDHTQVKVVNQRFLELAADLPREERLWLQSRAQPSRSREILREVFTEFPNIEYGLYLLSATPPHEHRMVFDTIEAIRRIPGALANPTVDLREASAALLAHDLPRARTAAAAAGVHAAALDDRYLQAEAKERESLILVALGEPSKAITIAEEAEKVLAAIGTSQARQRLWGLWESMARTHWAHGNIATARGLFEKSIAARPAPTGPSADVVRHEIALMLARNGELAEAADILRLLVTRRLDVPGEFRRRTEYEESLGAVQFRQGRFADAKAAIERALTAARSFAPKPGQIIARALAQQPVFGVEVRYGRQVEADLRLAMARLLFQQGDLAGAAQSCDEALDGYRQEPGARAGLTSGLATRAAILIARGDFAGAGPVFIEAAAALSPSMPMQQSPAIEIALGRAALALYERRLRDTYRFAEQAAAMSRTDSRPDDEAMAHITMALAALGEQDLRGAREEADRAEKIVKKENRLAVLAIGIGAARVTAAAATPYDVAGALERLEAVRREAATIGAVGLAFDARLALGEIELKSGRRASGRARLVALERDALAKGFALIARMSAAAARDPLAGR